MTPAYRPRRCPRIIPYQELLGNYDKYSLVQLVAYIIPYQELLGNYDGKKVLDDAE